jgi:hypothetical protein
VYVFTVLRKGDILKSRKVSIEDLFSEFGRNDPEYRELDSELLNAIALTRSGDWQGAKQIFQEYLKEHPDYDVPYIWLADFTAQNDDPIKTIEFLKDAARKCRRKGELLENAAELSLMKTGDVISTLRLFAQSVGVHEHKPHPTDITYQRACLFLREIFIVFGVSSGVQWADNMQHVTKLDQSLVFNIHQVIQKQFEAQYEDILPELLRILRCLHERFPSDD